MLKKILTLGILAATATMSFGQPVPMPVDYYHMYDPDASPVATTLGPVANPIVTLYRPFGMVSPYGFPWTGNQSSQEGDDVVIPTPDQRDDQETLSNSAAGEDDSSFGNFAEDLIFSMNEQEAEDATESYIDNMEELDDATTTDRLTVPYNVLDLLELTQVELDCAIDVVLPQDPPYGDPFDNFSSPYIYVNPTQQAPGILLFTPGVCPGAGCGGTLPGAMSSWGGAVNCPLHITSTPYTVSPLYGYTDLHMLYQKAVTRLFNQRRAIRHQFWLDVNAAVTAQDFDDLIADNIYYRTIAYDDFRIAISDAWNTLNP